MNRIAILGAGAFGAALAVAQASAGRSVCLWGRDPSAMQRAAAFRSLPRLAGANLPAEVAPTATMSDTDDADILLLTMPAQSLRGFLIDHRDRLSGRALVVCCKGIDLETALGPWSLLRQIVPDSRAAVLTGPSFAADIARGLPTALTLASEDESSDLQAGLSTPQLRLYRSRDPRGAELGGALKNVVAIAAGMAIGGGFGESARAAVVTRGFAEMTRLAAALGAMPETLAGLSGFGDLVLTCTSAQSRNYGFGQALGAGSTFDAAITVEGAATSRAVLPLAERHGVELPLAEAVAGVIAGELTPRAAAGSLLNRPLKHE